MPKYAGGGGFHLRAGPEKYREHGNAGPRKAGICQEGKATCNGKQERKELNVQNTNSKYLIYTGVLPYFARKVATVFPGS